MQVILKKDIEKLGYADDIVDDLSGTFHPDSP